MNFGVGGKGWEGNDPVTSSVVQFDEIHLDTLSGLMDVCVAMFYIHIHNTRSKMEVTLCCV